MPSQLPSDIFLIRHAEKPSKSFRGIDAAGRRSPRSLTVKGWQRAGALVAALAPFHGHVQVPGLVTPGFLFASSSRITDSKRNKSSRELETLGPLAHRLNLDINLDYDVNQESQAIAAALRCPAPVLLCWDHHRMAQLARYIPGSHQVPRNWPSERFDLVYAFHRAPNEATYTFSQIALTLLGGDSTAPLSK